MSANSLTINCSGTIYYNSGSITGFSLNTENNTFNSITISSTTLASDTIINYYFVSHSLGSQSISDLRIYYASSSTPSSYYGSTSIEPFNYYYKPLYIVNNNQIIPCNQNGVYCDGYITYSQGSPSEYYIYVSGITLNSSASVIVGQYQDFINNTNISIYNIPYTNTINYITSNQVPYEVIANITLPDGSTTNITTSGTLTVNAP